MRPDQNIRTETCWDPSEEEPHACPGRCGCYANHYCWPYCVCTNCGPTGHNNALNQETGDRTPRSDVFPDLVPP